MAEAFTLTKQKYSEQLYRVIKPERPGYPHLLQKPFY